MQRLISDGKRTEELTAQVTQLRRELEATWAIKRECPVTSVIVVTIDENPTTCSRHLRQAPPATCSRMPPKRR